MEVLRKAFKQQLDPHVSKFVACTDADVHLIAADIEGSLAHAQMLFKVGLIDEEQYMGIKSGLYEIIRQHEQGQFELKQEWEDVHMNVEKQLEVLIGNDALRLHTGRSRNDQVALDLRLYTRQKTGEVQELLKALQVALDKLAQSNQQVVLPGYTHLQRAQPLLFAHLVAAFSQMFARDGERFADSLKRTNISPLGAGALAGSSLPIDPAVSAATLGAESYFCNSLDAVSDRDFIVEFISAAALAGVHLSQLAETLIIWATSEFGFIKFADSVTTASSLMPNKKNPDPVEIIRGKAGSIIGELVNVLTTLKGLPIGYNRDLQETKPALINVAETLSASLHVMTIVLAAVELCPDKMLAAASDPYMCATDLVEYLVLKAVPFRQAHDAVSALIAYSREQAVPLPKLPLSQYKKFAAQFESDVLALFNPLHSACAKSSPGGTGNFAGIAAAS